ncbi:MAG: glutamine synthetase family protein [Dongiaceae bacterium]
MTTDFEATIAARKDKLQQLQQELTDKGARFINVHMAEVAGVFRSKTAPFKLAYNGDALNGILYCVQHSDGQPTGIPVFPGEISNDANGYPNIMCVPDPGTVRQHGWDPRYASVITNSFMLDGRRCPLDPRALLKDQEERARKMGYEPRFALEYEFGIFHADHDLMRAGRYRELKPWGHSYINYDLVRGGDYQDFVAQLIDRLASIGIGVASFVTEYGYGMYEFALAPKPPLEAADDAMRAKLHLREFCAERGLVATFMTRFQPPGKESACGGHHHQSLWRDGMNAFAAGPNQLTDVAQHYLAGMLQYLPDTHLLFRPTINSYRRMDRGAWSPEDCSWGYENRTAAVRAITTPTAEAARFEHRVPGADINPYLSIAAMLAAGLDGIEHKLPLEPAAPGNPAGLDRPLLARTLKDSIDRFRGSDFVARLFGPEFKAHYLLSREAEQEAFDTWLETQITDFEWQRYFIGT